MDNQKNIVNFKEWLENPLMGVKSKEEMIARLKTLSPNDKAKLLEWVENINKKEYAHTLGTNNPTLLYHGAPENQVKNIDAQGLITTKGTRSLGFMGAPYSVRNQGVFFTDSKAMAGYFGANRDELGKHKTIEVYANIDRLLDMTSLKDIPLNLRKLGLDILQKWEGKRKSKLSNADIWWLLDRPEFVDVIKSEGWRGVKFKEEKNIHKAVSKSWHYQGNANSYLLFYPEKDTKRKGSLDIIKNIDDLWNYISASL